MGSNDGEEEKETVKDSRQEPKKRSPFMRKVIKVLSVIVYVSGISGPGFLLSVYYIFLWDPQIVAQRPPGYENYLKSGPFAYDPNALDIPIEVLGYSKNGMHQNHQKLLHNFTIKSKFY